MRAALHVPDQPPEKAPPSSGSGRNDAFGLLAAGLLNLPQPYSPIKFGLVWNIDKRTWVHWDGNTKSPIARNLLASLGLGAPLHGKHADLQFEMVKRQTDLTEKIGRRCIRSQSIGQQHNAARHCSHLIAIRVMAGRRATNACIQQLRSALTRIARGCLHKSWRTVSIHFWLNLKPKVIGRRRKLASAAPVNISLRH